MLVLTLKPSTGKGARPVEDPRGPGDSVVIRVPPGDRERVILVTLSSLGGLDARIGFTSDLDIRIEREG